MDPRNDGLRAQAKAWNEFSLRHPDAPQDSWEAIVTWAQAKGIELDPELRSSKAASDTLVALEKRAGATPQTHETQASGAGVLDRLTALPALAISRFIPPRTLEEDPDYQKIEKRLSKEWQEKNPGKSWASREGLDFLYGSLDNPDTPTLHDLAEAEFRKPLDDPKKSEQRQKRIAKYEREREKVGKSKNYFEGDEAVIHVNRTIYEHTEKRYALALKEQPKATKEERKKLHEDIQKHAEEKTWHDFAKRYRKKAEGYEKLFGEEFAKKYPVLQNTLYKIRAQEAGNTLVESPMWEEQGGFAPAPPKPSLPPAVVPQPQPPLPQTPSETVVITSQTPHQAFSNEPQTTQRQQSENQEPRERRQPDGDIPSKEQEEAKQFLQEYVKNLWNKVRRVTPRPQPPQPSLPQVSSQPSAPNPVSGLAQKSMDRVRNQAMRTGAKALGNTARQAATKLAATALADNPITWIVLGIILVIILLVIIIILIACVSLNQCGGAPSNSQTAPAPGDPNIEIPIQGLTINKSGPSQVDFPNPITYSLSVTYTGAYEVSVIDPIPQYTEFLSATGIHSVQNNQVTWPLKQNTPASDGSYTFTVSVRPVKDNVVITNTAGGRITGGGNIGNLASCQFYRGDQRPPAGQYKSDILLGYFEEASIISGVPAAVLAAIARVESPGIINYTNETLATFPCATSPTGALGLMQIQPKGTKGHDAAAVKKGASYLGIPYDSLTKADYCDVRENIVLAAGFINQKRIYATGKEWDATRTYDKVYIDSVASTYYGCLRYSSCSSGPYSYGDDLWNSLRSCQQPTP